MVYIFRCDTSLFCKRILLVFILALILVVIGLVFSGIYFLYPEVRHFHNTICPIIKCHTYPDIYYDNNEKPYTRYYSSFTIELSLEEEYIHSYNKSFTIGRDIKIGDKYWNMEFCNDTFSVDCYYDDRNIQISLDITELRYVLGENLLWILSMLGIFSIVCILIWICCYYSYGLPKRTKKSKEDKEDKDIKAVVEIKIDKYKSDDDNAPSDAYDTGKSEGVDDTNIEEKFESEQEKEKIKKR